LGNGWLVLIASGVVGIALHVLVCIVISAGNWEEEWGPAAALDLNVDDCDISFMAGYYFLVQVNIL
jgi:hypothetical protein